MIRKSIGILVDILVYKIAVGDFSVKRSLKCSYDYYTDFQLHYEKNYHCPNLDYCQRMPYH